MLCHCFASFQQSLLHFFKVVDLRVVLVLLYDSESYNQWCSPITSGLLGSEKVKLKGLDNVMCKMCQCAVLLKDSSTMCLVAINILLIW